MLLVDADMDKKDVDDMMSDIDKVDGVKYTMDGKCSRSCSS